MVLSITNTFTSFALSPTEENTGSILNQYQLYLLQNDLSTVAEQKLNLTYDPHNHIEVALQDAYLKGQLDFIRYLLSRHEDAIVNNTSNS